MINNILTKFMTITTTVYDYSSLWNDW